MIVVLDTNVIVSSLLSASGSPAEIMAGWEADEFGVVISPSLLIELERVLKYPKVTKHLKLSQDVLSAFLRRIAIVATLIEPQISLNVIEEDPADNRVLECAVTSDASYIITGDKHLLQLKGYQGIVILPPSGFLALLKLEGKKRS